MEMQVSEINKLNSIKILTKLLKGKYLVYFLLYIVNLANSTSEYIWGVINKGYNEEQLRYI